MHDARRPDREIDRRCHRFIGPIQGLKVYQFHPFGLSALMIMPDSHIAIHTWPENEFASIDIFLQAQYDPNESLPLIQRYFHPDEVKIIELERGIKKGDGTLVLRGLHH
ncbi:MAG: S-adenosylmethionine decarboxylase [Candidatus Atribacteria bacterium]|nr:S-adenosylmethionine decarboxylase [Candidatus Atribacteria bacterium]